MKPAKHTHTHKHTEYNQKYWTEWYWRTENDGHIRHNHSEWSETKNIEEAFLFLGVRKTTKKNTFWIVSLFCEKNEKNKNLRE